MRYLLSLLLCIFFSAAAGAQIYALRFEDSKDVKRHRALLYRWNGQEYLLVELKNGVDRSSDGLLTWMGDERLEFYLQNQRDP